MILFSLFSYLGSKAFPRLKYHIGKCKAALSLFCWFVFPQIYIDRWLRGIHLTLRATHTPEGGWKISIVPKKNRTSCSIPHSHQCLPACPQRGSGTCSPLAKETAQLKGSTANPFGFIISRVELKGFFDWFCCFGGFFSNMLNSWAPSYVRNYVYLWVSNLRFFRGEKKRLS